MMMSCFLIWSCRAPRKYEVMLMDISTGEIGHVETPALATTFARLPETLPIEEQEGMSEDSIIGAMLDGARVGDATVAGMNPRHYIVSELAARPTDNVGNPWNAGFITASGNLLAVFRFNVTAERRAARLTTPHCRRSVRAAAARPRYRSRRWPSRASRTNQSRRCP